MAEATIQSGIEHHLAGRLVEAESVYRGILAADPQNAEALHLLGVIARQKGDIAGSIELISRAVTVKPGFADAHYNLAQILLKQGEFERAIASYRKVIELKPENVEAHNNLGIALKAMGCVDEAIGCFQQTIRLKPESAEAFYNLGNAQQMVRRLDDAEASYRRAIEIKPGYADALNNLGLVLAEEGRLDDAIANCRAAIKAKPDTVDAYINLLYALYHHPDYDAGKLLEETRVWARRQPRDAYIPAAEPLAGRRIRIGYLSPFFGMCADAHYILPLLAGHDREAFEIFGFTRAVRDDDVTARMMQHCDRWVDIRRLMVPAAVEIIRQSRLDVLVVMSRPADECQAIVAHRCAPAQMTWLTFSSATSGLATVDYRISDPFLDPPGIDENCYAEKTIRLPETAWCFDPLADISVGERAAGNGITFGSWNRLSKMNSAMVGTWAKVLAATPGSRIVILADEGSWRGRLIDEFNRGGIDRDRIEFIGRKSREEYLRGYDRIDVALDGWPFSGHTTALDSLWMGVPVVTLAGTTCVGRAAASALGNLGLGELVAKTPEEFVRIAANLARDRTRLAELRTNLRQKMQTSALMGGIKFARNIEAVYRELLARRR